MDYDYIIIGSGFGGSVSALRLAEKGYKVAVLEQGKRVTPAAMQAAATNPLKLFWLPQFGMKGYFSQDVLQHVGIVGGVGVGGGSIVYAAVLLEPKRAFFVDPAWSRLGIDWQQELTPHYTTAKRMLGRNPNPYFGSMDDYLRQTAVALNAADSFNTTPLGIYFGEPQVTQSDPYFDGRGPARTGCRHCGQCLTGCAYDAKNSLDKNYLYLAEQLGVKIFPERKVTEIRPLSPDGYQLKMKNVFNSGAGYAPLRARNVIVAAGVLGTLRLLFHCRDIAGTLPNLSQQLGHQVRTNSEAITAVLSDDAPDDLSTGGPAITTHFYPGNHTHITQNRFPQGYSFMKFYMGPLVDGSVPSQRALKTIASFLTNPRQATAAWRRRNWYQQVNVISVMQHLDNQLTLTYGRSPFTGFLRGLKSQLVNGKRAPTFIPEANAAARAFAEVAGGQPLNVWLESIGNLSITAHILGGCHMGTDPQSGVINTSHEVFGYPGLYVVDGAAVSANVGVNPSLTITALAERAMNLIPHAE